jgi:DNA-binding XRE family transcriptional regulator
LPTPSASTTRRSAIWERGDYTASLELAFRLTKFLRSPLSAIFYREPLRLMSEELCPAPAKVNKNPLRAGV